MTIPLTDPFSKGLWEQDVHYQIIDDWLNPSYESFAWNCETLNVRQLLKKGSDIVDGTPFQHDGLNIFNPPFHTAQSTKYSYQHAMRAGAKQSKSEAEA